MIKQKANRFIAANIQTFGLNGSNVTHNTPKHPRLLGGVPLYFSKNNHFVWGYNGNSYASRRSSSCMYFTDYLKQKFTGSVLPLDRSLVDIAEQLVDDYAAWDDVFIINRGRFEDFAFIEASKKAGTKFKQLVVRYAHEGHYQSIPLDPAVPHHTFHVTPDCLLDTARVVVPWLRTKSIDTILDITIARSMEFEESLIFPSKMKFVNNNHDGIHACGPPNWALCDAEEDTALLRYRWYDETSGVNLLTTNLATWSPELIASQLDHPEMRRCMMSAAPDADGATRNMWKSVSPQKYEFTDKPDWWESVQEEINEMHDGGKYNEKWITPLPRLLDRVGVKYPQEVIDGSYGTVY